MDHPHGGGRGKSKGNRHPTSPWGTPVWLTSSLEDEFSAQLLTHTLSRKVVTRHAERTIPTNGLWFLGYGTWASGETRRAKTHRIVLLRASHMHSVYITTYSLSEKSETSVLKCTILTEPSYNSSYHWLGILTTSCIFDR